MVTLSEFKIARLAKFSSGFLRSNSVMFKSVFESILSMHGFVRGPWKSARTRKLSVVRVVLVSTVIIVPISSTLKTIPVAIGPYLFFAKVV